MSFFDNSSDKKLNVFICKKCGDKSYVKKSYGTNHNFRCDVCNSCNFLLTDILHSSVNRLRDNTKWDSILSRYFTPEQIQEMINFRNTLPEESFEYAPYLTRDTQINHAQDQPEPTYTPTCPTCHSPDIAKIGSLDRAGSVLLFGVFSSKINKQFECKNCGYKW